MFEMPLDEQIVIFQKGSGNVVDIISFLSSRYEIIAGSEEE
jgi:hypothetical protein